MPGSVLHTRITLYAKFFDYDLHIKGFDGMEDP